MSELIVKKIVDDITLLKSAISNLCFLLNKSKVKAEILTQNYSDIEIIEDLSIPYSNFYYEDDDPEGNKVNSYYGYICCPSNKKIIEEVTLINMLKVNISSSIKNLRLFYKSNPPIFKKIIAKVDPIGRVNLKELTRLIVLIESDNSPIKKVSFQPEIINKGKGRCLTGSEIKFVINNYFEGVEGRYAQDLIQLNSIKSNELLSPIGAERRKCRVNISSEDKMFKGKYCSIPIIILSKPSIYFKTNLHSIFEKSFNKTRVDQQLEEVPFLAFRSFTRKKMGFKTFLSNDDLEERADYLISAFI
ncbi:hypothetical protein [Colwellia psychrerythraea]|uniref:Uncharacterized protein n=1 Tax=Colwellia psychrerythraea TaxID=28229 RepID=A0A099KEE8_COLPS|nr:hypothetical protein [Colwellia psychrerythraea]KGJ88412.1 hypothetical protein ND2E_4248 [Colwellia psychrerythraea]